VDDATVVEALPVLPVDGVEPVVDGVEVVGDVEAVVLPVLVLLDGVQGATVEVVPFPLVLLVPVALPLAVELDGLDPGVVVCSVPMDPVDPEEVELGDVEVVPGWVEVVPEGVEVVPCEVDVVPGAVGVVVDGLVVEGLVCPMPGLGVTVPVVCAEAMPIDRANTDDANKILRIELGSFFFCGSSSCRREKYFALSPANSSDAMYAPVRCSRQSC
jgi:hypothetical protein